MTDDQVAALTSGFRYLLTAIGGIAVGKGWLTNDAWQQITAGVLIIAPVAWSVFAKLRASK